MVLISVINALLPELDSSPGGLPVRLAVTRRAYAG
jgi:hypothetical protein